MMSAHPPTVTPSNSLPATRLPTDRMALSALMRGAMAVTEGLDVEQALSRIVEVAQEITAARYAACGVPGETTFRHFIYRGVPAALAAQIGPPPQGAGLLGVLLRQRESVRLERISEHPAHAGFPPHHPRTESFLGVPIVHRGRNVGVIYLAGKEGAATFSAEDQRAVELLAGFAAVAITNADQYLQVNEELEHRRDELDEATEILRALSNRTLWLLESERRQLAQELNDGIGQVLAAGVFAADVIVEGGEDPKDGAARLRDILRQAMADVRRISHGLRPSVLDELGPLAAIRAVAEELDSSRHGRIEVETVGKVRRLPEPLETVLYRVAQEALTNAVHHSGASRIQAELSYETAQVRLTVEDNGIGMPATPARPGLGLAGMRERAALVNGSLSIESKPGRGVRLVLTMPDA